MSINTLHERLPASARVVTYRGAPAPAVYSDAGSEFVSFRSGCGVFESSWRSKVILTGSDRVRWLNGMITNNVRDLASNRAVYAFLLNPQGRILADLYAYNRGEYLLVDTDRFQLEKVLATFCLLYTSPSPRD